MVLWLFLAVPWVCLQFVIVVFPDHNHLLFFTVFKRFNCLGADRYKVICSLGKKKLLRQADSGLLLVRGLAEFFLHPCISAVWPELLCLLYI